MKNNYTIYKVMTPMKSFGTKTRHNWVALLLTLALPLTSVAAEQLTFATPEAAVEALTSALKTNDANAIVSIFGSKYKKLIITGDDANDSARRAETVEKLAEYRALEEQSDGSRQLIIGAEAWPMPIPLVQENGVWRFASEQGMEEMLNRRIGKNERNAIDVLSAYLDAQRQYASIDRNGDGVLEYAKKLASSPNRQDGLYWPADIAKGEEISPFGPLIAESSAYLAGHKQGDPYHGYHFKIITRQGKSAPGGAYNYVINGRMIAGFAMVAYPSDYGVSGVMSFIVSHNGKVYEKDLGKNTKNLGTKLISFNPDKSWNEVPADNR
jgi:hypothetical protein